MSLPIICGRRVGSSGCCMQLLTDNCTVSSNSFTWSSFTHIRYLHLSTVVTYLTSCSPSRESRASVQRQHLVSHTNEAHVHSLQLQKMLGTLWETG